MRTGRTSLESAGARNILEGFEAAICIAFVGFGAGARNSLAGMGCS